MRQIACAHLDDGAGPRSSGRSNQAARSLLLAQASDWAFIMRTGTAVDYAHGRTRDHLARFHWLADAVDAGAVDEERLAALETMDNIFPAIDYRIYAT